MDVASLAAVAVSMQAAEASLQMSIAVQKQQAEAAQAIADLVSQATAQIVSANSVDIQV